MNWFGGRIARDEIHSSIQRWFVRVFCVSILLAPALTHSNPYLAKPGEARVSVYVSTCAVTGGFVARENGFKVTKKSPYLIDGSFVENLDKTGFLKELWGGNVP